MSKPKHPWQFRSRFRANAFGWKGSKLACERLKQAITEIKKVARTDPLLGADGAILLMEKLWPALAQVDTSSGALGTAAGKTVHALIDIVLAAPVDAIQNEHWLERLQQAVDDDGVDYLWEVAERWGELCRTPERASRFADETLSLVRGSWQSPGGYCKWTPACLSCLLTAQRYEELLALIDTAPYLIWGYRRFGVQALAAMGRTDAAIDYAQASHGLNNSPIAIAQACEALLLDAGRSEEAYACFALQANQGTTHLATCRALIKKYPDNDPRMILNDLIAANPSEPGRWFATAKTLGFLELAAELAERSPVDIGTLLRAARDYQDANPTFALQAALAALRWMAAGRYYELTASDVWQARRFAIETAERTGKSEPVRAFLDDLTASTGTDGFVRKQLQAG